MPDITINKRPDGVPLSVDFGAVTIAFNNLTDREVYDLGKACEQVWEHRDKNPDEQITARGR